MPEFPSVIELPDYKMHLTAISGTGGDTGTWASSAWPSANRAVYIPVRLKRPMAVANIFVLNGAAVNGNLDIGVYSKDGTRLASTGSVAQAGISVIQAIALSCLLGSGYFYLAMSMNNNVGHTYRQSPNNWLFMAAGYFFENNAFPLPAIATFASFSGAGTYAPLIGITPRAFV